MFSSQISRILHSSLLRMAGTYVGSNILNAAVPFLMLPILTRYLTPKDYGIVSMFQVLAAVIAPFSGLALHGAISRQYFERDRINFPQYLGNCLYILVVSTLITAFILLSFKKSVAEFAQFPETGYGVFLSFPSATF